MVTTLPAARHEYRPDEPVPNSGIYLVTHDDNHEQPHEVTVIQGRPFPPCNRCDRPRFKLVRPAIYIGNHHNFARRRSLKSKKPLPSPTGPLVPAE
jgi:hypothetical protein